MEKSLRVLVVDDEIINLRIVSMLLRRRGYLVVAECSGGEEAFAAFSKNPAGFDLVITDYSMGSGMTGTELARDVRKLGPGMPVILATASSPNAIIPRDHGCVYLEKPLDARKLELAIARAIKQRV